MTRVLQKLLFLAVLAACVGCGDAVGPTSGVVRFRDGSPVTSGSIELRRTTDKECFVSRIAADGTFNPANQDGDVGLPPGTYDVVVVQVVLTEDLPIEAHTHGKTVPRRYADYYTSGLQVEVKNQEQGPIEVILNAADDG